MRYAKGHKIQTRSRIIENVSYGLRQRGLAGVSVADLMKLAGLTHGGFYSHFESRDARRFALVLLSPKNFWRPFGCEVLVARALLTGAIT